MKNNTIVTAFIWKAFEKLGTKGIQFIIQIFLARLLFPDDYGMAAILAVFITLSNVFIQGGFSTALIQKREASEVDFSTALFTSFGIALVFYALLFAGAPWIADFYGMQELKPLLRAIAAVLFAGAINSIQYAYISRKLQFRSYTMAVLLSSGCSGILGIWMASRGYGVWTLAVQQIAANYLAVIFLFFFVKWRPKPVFSLQSLREMFGYGWKILGSGLINSLYMSMYNLVIGKVYSSELLGLYNRGDQFPNLLVSNVNDTVQSIVLPVMANVQEEPGRVKEFMKKGLVLNAFLIIPMMMGLAAVSEPLVTVLLTDRWLSVVPYMQLLCILYMMYPIHTMNIQCMKAMGRSDLFLKLEIVKKLIETLILAFTIPHGLGVMIAGQIISSLAGIPLNIYPVGRLIGYGFREQMRDISPTFFAGLLMAGAVRLIGAFVLLAPLPMLVLQISAGVLVFACVSLGIKNPAVYYAVRAMRERNGEKN